VLNVYVFPTSMTSVELCNPTNARSRVFRSLQKIAVSESMCHLLALYLTTYSITFGGNLYLRLKFERRCNICGSIVG
jgi:hypothetical protein